MFKYTRKRSGLGRIKFLYSKFGSAVSSVKTPWKVELPRVGQNFSIRCESPGYIQLSCKGLPVGIKRCLKKLIFNDKSLAKSATLSCYCEKTLECRETASQLFDQKLAWFQTLPRPPRGKQVLAKTCTIILLCFVVSFASSVRVKCVLPLNS